MHSSHPAKLHVPGVLSTCLGLTRRADPMQYWIFGFCMMPSPAVSMAQGSSADASTDKSAASMLAATFGHLLGGLVYRLLTSTRKTDRC